MNDSPPVRPPGTRGPLPTGPSVAHAQPASPPRRFEQVVLEFLRALRARMYVRVIGSFREPSWIISDAVFPALGMCAFVLLYRGLGAPKSYEALAVFGGVLSTYWINVLWGMSAQLFWEKQQGQLQLYFAAPCSKMAIFAGMAIGGCVATSVRTLFAVVLGVFVFGVRVYNVDVALLVFVFVVTMAALYALGMILASLFLLHGREAWHLCNACMEPVYFVSGLYFPLRTLGAAGAVFAGLIPLGFGVDAMRQVLLGDAAHGLLPVWVETSILIVLAVGFTALASLAFRHLENLSKREGRLTQRWG